IKVAYSSMLAGLRLRRAQVIAERVITTDKNLEATDLSEEDATTLLNDRKESLQKIYENAKKAQEIFTQLNKKTLPKAETEAARAVATMLSEGNTKNFLNRHILDGKTKLKVRVDGAVREITSTGSFR